MECEQNNEQYVIDLSLCDDTSLDFKMKVINMINKFSINHKVGWIRIRLNNNCNEFNQQTLRIMIKNYQNLYKIVLFDNSGSVDIDIYNQIKQLLKQSTVLEFTLCF